MVAAALVFCALRATRLAPFVVAGAVLFQASSLAVVILTRTGTFFGWTEPIWTRGAAQSRAVEIGALLALGAVAAIAAVQRSDGQTRPSLAAPVDRSGPLSA